jgi:hypothetical protein
MCAVASQWGSAPHARAICTAIFGLKRIRVLERPRLQRICAGRVTLCKCSIKLQCDLTMASFTPLSDRPSGSAEIVTASFAWWSQGRSSLPICSMKPHTKPAGSGAAAVAPASCGWEFTLC